jgi:hypothetical protein
LDLILQHIAAIAHRLLEDTPAGDLLRETRPPFGQGVRSRDGVRVVEAMDAEKRQH